MSIIAELLCGGDFFCGDFVGGEMTVNLFSRIYSVHRDPQDLMEKWRTLNRLLHKQNQQFKIPVRSERFEDRRFASLRRL